MRRIQEDSIGFRIRTARSNVNMNQKMLADAVGTGSNHLSAVERGTKRASDDLLIRIAAATHTTYSWLKGDETENSRIFPEMESYESQIKGDTATKSLLIEILRNGCSEVCDPIEPEKISDFPPADWRPDYWFEISNSKIKRWAFDLSACIYFQPDIFSKDPKNDLKWNYFNFTANMVFSNPNIRPTTKYTFVVANEDVFNYCRKKKFKVSLGNVSVMQIDIQTRTIVNEAYLSLISSLDPDTVQELTSKLSLEKK